MRRIMGAGLVALAATFLAAPASGQGAEPEEETIVFLVRHAETEPDGTRDPALSAEGIQRAGRLAEVLADAGLDAVYTTDYGRTRGTAGAIVGLLGLEPTLYNPARLETFAKALLERGGRILVVGHSNTTPELVAELGGEPGSVVAEAEYDRLYVLFIGGDAVRTILLRY